MQIRKLTEADYVQVVLLYMELDDIHARARPDCFVHRSKEETYPRMPIFPICPVRMCCSWVLSTEKSLREFCGQPYGKKASWSKI